MSLLSSLKPGLYLLAAALFISGIDIAAQHTQACEHRAEFLQQHCLAR